MPQCMLPSPRRKYGLVSSPPRNFALEQEMQVCFQRNMMLRVIPFVGFAVVAPWSPLCINNEMKSKIGILCLQKAGDPSCLSPRGSMSGPGCEDGAGGCARVQRGCSPCRGIQGDHHSPEELNSTSGWSKWGKGRRRAGASPVCYFCWVRWVNCEFRKRDGDFFFPVVTDWRAWEGEKEKASHALGAAPRALRCIM